MVRRRYADPTPAAPVPAGFSITPDTVEMRKGQVVPLACNADGPVEWSSSDATVANVKPDGVVHAVGEGNVTIKATAGEQSAEASISVTA